MNTVEKKVSHTPGQWRVTKHPNEEVLSIHVGSEPQDELGDNSICGVWDLSDEGRANAKLIAAAPELLAELQTARAKFKSMATTVWREKKRFEKEY